MSEQGSAAWKHQSTIPSDTSIGSSLIVGLLEAMEQFGWPPQDIFRVQLAYEEAIVNAIRHGNRFADDKTVDVHMHCDMDQVSIEITDMGAGFDPRSVPDPRDDDRLEIPGGRGVMLIQELMTFVDYNERGNRVHMRKIRSTEEELAAEESDE